jgi:N-acetylglucosaminylphosphatidylinositol deacetylase
MLFIIPKVIFRLIIVSFGLWVILSTSIPQLKLKFNNHQIKTNKFEVDQYPYDSLTSPEIIPIQNSTVYYIIGHPDDEVMFFSPSIIELLKPKYNNLIKLICFSNGNSLDDSLGKIRSQELYHSGRILGIEQKNIEILNYQDGMNVTWDSIKICQSLKKLIGTNHQNLVLITFDAQGVSNHINHVSLYHGSLKFFNTYYKKSTNKLYLLKSLNFLEKYSFTLLTNIELFFNHLSASLFSNLLNLNINVSFYQNLANKSSIKFYSDLNMLSISYAAMCYGHFSQMVWFRYAWLILSRYLTYNHLIEVV